MVASSEDGLMPRSRRICVSTVVFEPYGRVMVVYVDVHAGPAGHICERPYPRRGAYVYQYEPGYPGEIYVLELRYRIGERERIDGVLEGLLERAREDEQGVRVEPFRRRHRGKGVEIRVYMGGYDFHKADISILEGSGEIALFIFVFLKERGITRSEHKVGGRASEPRQRERCLIRHRSNKGRARRKGAESERSLMPKKSAAARKRLLL